MKIFNVILILLTCFFLTSQSANAAIISEAVDLTITGLSKTTYLVTKYTLKSVWFITKKTAKGIKLISVSAYNATKDAFDSKPKTTPLSTSSKSNIKMTPVNNSLPPIPKTTVPKNLPSVSDPNLPVIKY